MTGNEIRKNLIDARDNYIREIKHELLGPGSEFGIPDADHELISSSPTSRYSVGILFPQGNLIEQDNDETVPLESEEEASMAEAAGIALEPAENAPAKKAERSYEFDETADENLDEEIGMASAEIAKGEYVHVHNLESMRGRGDWEKGGRHE